MKVSKYFDSKEFACKCGCGFDTIDKTLLDKLDLIRERFGKPIIINSGCRCARHNKACGSSSDNHTKGVAVDIKIASSQTAFDIVRLAMQAGIDRIGVAKTFIHLDINTKPKSLWLY